MGPLVPVLAPSLKWTKTAQFAYVDEAQRQGATHVVWPEFAPLPAWWPPRATSLPLEEFARLSGNGRAGVGPGHDLR